MSATILTAEAAKAANIEVITNGKYGQAVHETVVALRANRRSGTASVKTKATVNGSGAKPWNQKGTGRARAGYKSSPVWSGGGVVFGPHPRDYSKKVSKQTRRIALRKALSARILNGDVLIVPTFSVAKPKTKDFVKLLSEVSPEAKTLIIGTDFDDNTRLAARNVQPATLACASDVNTEHLLLYKKIVVTNDALAQLAERINK
ncbi:MAG: 50S ribosomal protein L4 [Chthoniobacteraceae bacterium]